MHFFSRKKGAKSDAGDTSTDASSAATPEAPQTTAPFPTGIKTWIECPDATVDICFLHGLTGDRDQTWTAKGQSEPWPAKLIPEALQALATKRGPQNVPKFRILTYGYDAYVVKMEVSSQNGLRDHAQHFLKEVVTDRELSDATGRPIILVAHSLGGLVSKKAVLLSRNNPDAYLRDLYASVKGIVFMGTPHRGSWMARWAGISAGALGFVKSTNKTILNILRTDDKLLEDVQKDFWNMVREQREGGRKLDVVCFFEELPLPVIGKKVVEQASATLEGYEEVSVHANHSTMVKFATKEHGGFNALFGTLVRWGGPSVDKSQVSDCLKSLSFPEMHSRLADVTVAAEGTLTWLVEHPMHSAWADNDRGVLWIRGKPGSGKSTLMRRILERTEARLKDNKETLILSFFFHRRGTELQKTPLGLYRALLHKIMAVAPESLAAMIATYKERTDTRGKAGEAWDWDEDELKRYLKDALGKVSRTRPVWLFIDALDEVGETDALDLITSSASLNENLPTAAQFRFCFSSRHYPVLAEDFPVNICLEDENLSDITKFVKSNCQKLTTDKIPNLIIKRASGIFMWARLVTERVLKLKREGMDEVEIETKVNGVTSGLWDLYAEVLAELEDAASVQLFDWVCFAHTPLTPEALLCAVGAEVPRQTKVPKPNEPVANAEEPESQLSRMQRRIGSLSGGLAEFVEIKEIFGQSTTTVQFIHQSVQDFYMSRGLAAAHPSPIDTPKARLVGEAHDRISRACIRYWAQDEAVSRARSGGQAIDSVRVAFPLLEYAIGSWAHHARESEQAGLPQDHILTEEYLDWKSTDRVNAMILVENAFKTRGDWRGSTTISHVLAREGLVGALRCLMDLIRREGLASLDFQDSGERTPFFVAVESGRIGVVKLFLDETIPRNNSWTAWWLPGLPSWTSTPKVLQTDFDSRNRTSTLSSAVRSRNSNMVKLLIDSGRVDVNARAPDGGIEDSTPLDVAIRMGEHTMMQDLLSCDRVDPNIGLDWSLFRAIGSKNRIALQILLDSGKVDVNRSALGDLFGLPQPLTYAAEQTNWHAVEALLKTGKVYAGLKRPWSPLDLNAFRTPCHSAVYYVILYRRQSLLVRIRDAKVNGIAPNERERIDRVRGGVEEVFPEMPPEEVQQLAEELLDDDVSGAKIWTMQLPGRDDGFEFDLKW